jgi:hypothetical protein
MMKAFAVAILALNLIGFQSSFANYPVGPAQELTPGQLCSNPNSHRYPEKINYCDRDVSTTLKNQIIADYDRTYQYDIDKMPRQDFKIDHFIPLCMGGSNDISNLWPQHKSVFKLTDPLEEAICSKMSQGKLEQKEAVRLIMSAKRNLKQVSNILNFVRKL